MRNTTTIIASLGLLLSVLLTGCGSKYDRSTPEAFAQSLVKCINSKDKDGLRDFVPTKDELIGALESGDGSAEDKAEMKKEMLEDWPKMEERMEERIFGGFDELIQESEAEGKDLSKITYKSVDLGDERNNDGLTMRNITAICDYEGEEVKVRVRNAAKFSSGWVMSPSGF
ncbi:MAG: hypothetical protein AAF570_11850, partial [Bacteroidota bacterium]